MRGARRYKGPGVAAVAAAVWLVLGARRPGGGGGGGGGGCGCCFSGECR
jgi:hypothetical protein